ncbi:hypothetical protein HHL24_01395 [Paraburkholderia sp. RP-4-7]|uniref:Uncharacterized protein n=1 Tax=Paraburkholderia polaris TaxID=2728848 RepID=A0A848I2L7_9BURK|nr:hypothetical protein [Paraburkholderia polaris]NML96621.1 hypothetical protein [Paraburkholderia polaris]
MDTNVNALTKLPVPNIAVAVTFADAGAVLLDRVGKLGVTELSLEGDQQLVKADAKFDRTFGKADAGKDTELASTLDKLKPHVVGEVVAYVGITGGVTADPEQPTLELKLLPLLSTVVVSKIELADKYDVTLAGKAVASVLNQFKENIAGELTRAALTTVTVPALSNKPLNISGPLKVNDPNLKVSVSANPITAPLRLDGIASLVTSKQLTVIAQVSPVAITSPPQAVAVDNSQDGIQKRVSDIVGQMLEVRDAQSHTWVAIRKDVIAVATNAVFAQAGACISATGAIPQQNFSVKLQTPSGAGLNCNIVPNCPAGSCPFTAKHAPGCGNVCIAPVPGGCLKYGPNLPCQAQQHAQQQIYDAQALTNQGVCLTQQAAKVSACMGLAASKALACRQDQTALANLNKTGPFAILSGVANVHTSDAKICLNSMLVSPSLDQIQMAVDVTGTAYAEVTLNYDPRNAGLILCPNPWSTKAPTLTATLHQPVLNISTQAAVVNDQDGLHIDFTVDKTPLKAQMTPAPTALLLKTPQLIRNCPAVAGAAPLAIALTPFVPQLQGDIDLSVPAHTVSVPVRPFSPKLGDRHVTVTVETAASAPTIVVSAALADGANGGQKK